MRCACISWCCAVQELGRNAHGTCHVYQFDSELEPFTYPSPWTQVFPDITSCKVRSATCVCVRACECVCVCVCVRVSE